MIVGLAIVASTFVSCGPTPPPGHRDPWFDEESPPLISGDLDEAEKRWRKDIEGERTTDADALLKDDPAKDPGEYGKVAFGDEEPPPPPPTTFWGKFKVGMNSFGRATFAAMTVLVTVGMMVAPYLLL